MGSIDPVPQTGKVHRTERPSPPELAKPKPILPTTPTLGLPGVLGILVGLAFFAAGAMTGWNLLTMGIGVAFIAAGWATRTKPPKKLCPACRMEIPLDAGLCGYCRTEQPA